MKKTMVIFLTFVMVLSLIGCGANTGENAGENTENTENTSQGALSIDGEGFRAGFGRACITPEENLPMGGYGTSSTRIMQDVLDDTYVDCIALTDENDFTVLFMLVDLQRIDDMLISLLRMSVATATGIPEEQIIISSSHTHSVPDLTLNSHEGITRYKALLTERFAQAAVQAIKDSMPAELYNGSIETEGLAFVRHYQYIDSEGNVQYFGSNFGTAVFNETTQHVLEPWETMRVLKFAREGGKDIILCSFQAHPHLTGGAAIKDLSSDYIGPFREAVEYKLNVHCSFVQGTSGDLNERSSIASENFSTENNHREYGYRLANYCIECVENNMTPAETGPIQYKQIMYTAAVDHSEDNMESYAILVSQFFSKTHSHADTRVYAAQFGIRSVYHASSIRVRAGMSQTQDIELAVFSIGDAVGFYVAPGELFSQCGREMEAASPFDMTIAICLADGDWKYFPYGVCAEYDSYESDYCRFIDGTCEQMMQIWQKELENQYENALNG